MSISAQLSYARHESFKHYQHIVTCIRQLTGLTSDEFNLLLQVAMEDVESNEHVVELAAMSQKLDAKLAEVTQQTDKA